MSDLRARVESLDAVPEPLRSFYTPQGNAFVLNLPDAEDVYAGGLKKNRDDVLTQLAAEKAERKKFDGLDIEKARAALAAQAQAEQDKAAAAGNFEALKAALVKAHADEKTSLETQSKELQAALFDALATTQLQVAIDALDGHQVALMPHLKPQIKIEKIDGQHVARVVDAKGNVRYAGSQGEPMTIKALVEETKKNTEFAWGFKGTGASGGGAPSGGRADPASRSPSVVGADAFLANLDAIAKGTVKVAL